MARYAGFNVNKVKLTSYGQLNAAFLHNHDPEKRAEYAPSADHERTHLNVELIDRHGKTYNQLIRERVQYFSEIGAIGHKVRSNAVGAIEVVLRANGVYLDDNGRPKGEPFDIDAWARRSIDWLDSAFNPAAHQVMYMDKEGNPCFTRTNNVCAAALHLDETTPHIHAIVVPITERGKLDCTYYFQGSDIMSRYITSYAKAVEEFGLERGIRGSVSKVVPMKQFYAQVSKALSATHPEHLPNETMQEYDARVDEVIQQLNSTITDIKTHTAQEVDRAHAEARVLKQEIREEHKAINKALGEPERDSIDLERVHAIGRSSRAHGRIKEALAEYPDRTAAQKTQEELNQMLQWLRTRELLEKSGRRDRSEERSER